MLDAIKHCVEKGENLGADFVEARYEDLTLRTLDRTDDTWKEIQSKSRRGVGVTCYVEGVSGFSFTASLEKGDLEAATERSYRMAKASAGAAKLKLPFDERPAVKSSASDTRSVKIHPRERELSFKTDMVNRAVETAREHGENIKNVRGLYGELFGQKLLTNSDGSVVDWEFLVTDMRCSVTSRTEAGNLVTGREGHGGTFGLEFFETNGQTPEDIGATAGDIAKEQLEAKACPAGQFRTLIENHLVGVLAHESFGHLSEADFVVTGGSPLTSKMDERLGTEHATIVDGGVPDIDELGGLWVPFDDQGIPCSMTKVLDEGVLTHYLHNRGTAEKLGQKPTGNARAVNFVFPPIPRMTNTFFEPGDLTEEEALEMVDEGVYAIQTSGGQVSGDGSFLFKAIRGYWVEDGEIQYPLREVSLSGNILQLLAQVEGATKELELYSGYFGGCGKGDQFPLPTGLGGPKLVMDGVTFGGEA
ncbi:MAG: TldD/PmbA family protein [Candidatus Thorarchaeota archaeon]